MKKPVQILVSRWVLSFVGTALLAVLVWLFGPFVPALDSPLARGAVVLAMLALWAALNLLMDARRRRRDAALMQGAASGPDPVAAASAEEAGAMRERLTAALAHLRRARGTSGFLYEQPWYVIIGPPGAGKTTALLNAGLRFPLAAEMGQGAVAGVGGTRMCDWWFTEQAVLIDTAGRYTTQDSNAAVDSAGWHAFLDLLRRTRGRQPLNGVLVAIALSDIAEAQPAERLAHARAIRRRLKELEERLGVRLPVYALFTKADLITGFVEFFDDLDRERRAQVWGTTFAPAQPEAGPVQDFPERFHGLVQRLNERLLDRLQAERSPERRALIAGFPAQVASLEQPLAEFLQEAFGGSRLDPAPMLRGAYLTSGTQEGTPFDRLTGALARSFGLDQRRLPSLRPEQGRSYFLGRLLRDVIFGEAMLVSLRPGVARRRRLLTAGGFAAAAIVLAAGAGLLWNARASNAQRIDRLAQADSAYGQHLRALPLDPVAEADLPRIVPVLDEARALPFGADAGGGGSTLSVLGLSQSAKLGMASRTAYRHALERILLPRLVWRLEAQMRANLDRPDFLYEATRVYLMLGGLGPLDAGLVRQWMALDWQAAYPGPAMAPVRASLARHLDALLAAPLPPVALDGGLVAAARATFSRVPLAQRVYSRIRPSEAAERLPAWQPAQALGAAGAQFFVRASGRLMTEGIPGFFTPQGFHEVLLPALGHAAKDVAEESWVLGHQAEIRPDSPEMRSLEHDVVALYEQDYARQWDALLADIDVTPLRSLQQASQALYILGSPQSPMQDLLAAIGRELTLSAPPAAAGAAGTAKAAATSAVTAASAQLQKVFGAASAGAAAVPPGQEIDARYQALRMVGEKGLGPVLQLINDLQRQLSALASAPPGTPPAISGDDPAQLLRTQAAQEPPPVARWLVAIADGAEALRGGGARQQVAAAFSASGGPGALCSAAVAGRFPFDAAAANSIPLGDFARLFAPNGLLDTFFNTQLRGFVDTSGPVWHARAVNGVPPPVSPSALAAFQRAARVRDAFFTNGGTTPSVRFEITPVSLDSGANQVTIDFGGTVLSYAHGPVRGTQVTWPGDGTADRVRVVFDPAGGGTGVLEASGPWALFRLFQEGRLQPAGSPDHYMLTLQQGARRAVFDIRAGSVVNPLIPGLMTGFRCPGLS